MNATSPSYYRAMRTDPLDRCSFWYSQQDTDQAGAWRTRIVAFEPPSCDRHP